MKKLLAILAVAICGYAYADLPAGITCDKKPLSMNMAESALEDQCIADSVKTEGTTAQQKPNKIYYVKFIADDNSLNICSYKNNKLLECGPLKLDFQSRCTSNACTSH